MSLAPRPCPNCGGVAFDGGFVDDVAQGRIRWVPGRLEVGLFGNARRRGRGGSLPVLADRCRQCGHLDLFATAPPSDGDQAVR